MNWTNILERMSIIILFASLLASTGALGYTLPQAPVGAPYVGVAHNSETIFVNGYTPNANLTFKFYNELDQLVYQITMPTFNNSTSYVLFDFQHDTDIQPGFRVTVTDESAQITKEVRVLDLTVTQFTSGTSEVGGKAPAESIVFGDIDDGATQCLFSVTTDPQGDWLKNLTQVCPGYTIGSTANLDVRINDEDGDHTSYQITFNRPDMEVVLGEDVIHCINCMPNGPVDLEVRQNNNRIFGPWQLKAGSEGGPGFEVWKGGLKLEPGMEIILHELSRDIIKSIEIVSFSGTHDTETNRLSGDAPSNRTFPVEICTVALPCYHVQVTADENGYWEHDLGAQELTGWTGFLYDNDGDALNANKGIAPKHPYIYADLHTNLIVPFYYLPGIQASLRVYPTHLPVSPVISETLDLANGTAAFFTDMVGVDLTYGMRLDVMDVIYNGTTRVISTTMDFIAITDFITSTNTVVGLANPGQKLIASVRTANNETHTKDITAGLDGTWQAAFDPLLDVVSMKGHILNSQGHYTAFEIVPGGLIKQVSTQGNSLTASDAQGDQTVIMIPVDAVTQTVSLAFTPVTGTEMPAGFSFAGTGFNLDAYQNGSPLGNFSFQNPITITLNYSDEDILNIDENTLQLSYWEQATSSWIDAATTCNPASQYERFPEENYLRIAICHLSRFALIGESDYLIWLPLVLRIP